jgi:hypothetical protein
MSVAKTNLFTIASDLRYFLLTGLETLPLTLGGTLLLIGLFSANYPMIFFLVGYLVVVPLTTFIFNLLSPTTDIKNPFTWGGKDDDVCNVITRYGASDRAKNNTIVSYWMAMVSFFIGYMFSNGLSLHGYNMPTIPSTEDKNSQARLAEQLGRRKAYTMTSMILTIILFVGIILYRYYYTCDGVVSIIVGIVFAVFGGLWYTWLAKIADDRFSDLFGIANRLLQSSALINMPYACLPPATA